MSEEFPGYDGPMKTCSNPACNRTLPATREYFYWWSTKGRLFHRCIECGKAATRAYRATQHGHASQYNANRFSSAAVKVPFFRVLRAAQKQSLEELNVYLLAFHIPPIEAGVDYDKGATQ